MAHEMTGSCAFSTDRLVVGDWHDLADRYGLDLVGIVRTVLTTTTTAALPPDWHGNFDRHRADQWVQAREAESPTLLVVDPEPGRAIGFLILFESPSRQEPALVDVRLGYVLAEAAWGKGLASELVSGLVEWARSKGSIKSISGGVAKDNPASAQVLLNNGFAAVDYDGDGESDEQTYELVLY